jgi:hypothetical protein
MIMMVRHWGQEKQERGEGRRTVNSFESVIICFAASAK